VFRVFRVFRVMPNFLFQRAHSPLLQVKTPRNNPKHPKQEVHSQWVIVFQVLEIADGPIWLAGRCIKKSYRAPVIGST
jgi:hypothetical protein